MERLHGICCIGLNMDDLVREKFVVDEKFQQKVVDLKTNKQINATIENLSFCNFGLNGKSIVLVSAKEHEMEHGMEDKPTEERTLYCEYFMFYEGNLSLMFTKLLPLPNRHEECIISSDHTFAIHIEDTVSADCVSFSVRILDHKKYSKVTAGKLCKKVKTLLFPGKLLYQTVHCLSKDNSLFCYVMNGLWRNKKERFCEVHIFKCCKEENNRLTFDEIFQKNIQELEVMDEISFCEFNLTGDKLLLIRGRTYVILGIKSVDNFLLAKGKFKNFERSDIFWTIDMDHGEFVVEIDRANLLVNIRVLDLHDKKLKVFRTISLSYICKFSLEHAVFAVSFGISRIFIGTNQLVCINPFTGTVEDHFHFAENVHSNNSYFIKNIIPNWPSKDILVIIKTDGGYLLKILSLKLKTVLSLKCLAAIETVFHHSLISLNALNLPKSVKYYLNL